MVPALGFRFAGGVWKEGPAGLKGTCRRGGIRKGDPATTGTPPSTCSSAIDDSFHFLGFNVLLLLQSGKVGLKSGPHSMTRQHDM